MNYREALIMQRAQQAVKDQDLARQLTQHMRGFIAEEVAAADFAVDEADVAAAVWVAVFGEGADETRKKIKELVKEAVREVLDEEVA